MFGVSMNTGLLPVEVSQNESGDEISSEIRVEGLAQPKVLERIPSADVRKRKAEHCEGPESKMVRLNQTVVEETKPVLTDHQKKQLAFLGVMSKLFNEDVSKMVEGKNRLRQEFVRDLKPLLLRFKGNLDQIARYVVACNKLIPIPSCFLLPLAVRFLDLAKGNSGLALNNFEKMRKSAEAYAGEGFSGHEKESLVNFLKDKSKFIGFLKDDENARELYGLFGNNEHEVVIFLKNFNAEGEFRDPGNYIEPELMRSACSFLEATKGDINESLCAARLFNRCDEDTSEELFIELLDSFGGDVSEMESFIDQLKKVFQEQVGAENFKLDDSFLNVAYFLSSGFGGRYEAALQYLEEVIDCLDENDCPVIPEFVSMVLGISVNKVSDSARKKVVEFWAKCFQILKAADSLEGIEPADLADIADIYDNSNENSAFTLSYLKGGLTRLKELDADFKSKSEKIKQLGNAMPRLSDEAESKVVKALDEIRTVSNLDFSLMASTPFKTEELMAMLKKANAPSSGYALQELCHARILRALGDNDVAGLNGVLPSAERDRVKEYPLCKYVVKYPGV